MIRRKLSKFISLDQNPNFVVESLDILDVNSGAKNNSASPSPPGSPTIESKTSAAKANNDENKPVSPSIQRKQSFFMKPLEILTRVRALTNSSQPSKTSPEAPSVIPITDPFQLLPNDILTDILVRAVFHSPNNQVDEKISNLKTFTLVSQKLRKMCTTRIFWQPIWDEIASPYRKEQMKLDSSDFSISTALALKKDCFDIQQQKIPYCKSTVQFVNHTGDVEMKVIIVATSYGIGEMNLTRRFINDTYSEEYDPRIEDFYRKQIEIDGVSVFLDITIPGCGYDDMVVAMKQQWLRSQEGIILVYACNSRTSFEELESAWLIPYLQIRDLAEAQVPMVLVCNKIDIFPDQRQVAREEGVRMAARLNCPYIETSAKLNINTVKPWIEIVRQIRYHRWNKLAARQTMELLDPKKSVVLPN